RPGAGDRPAPARVARAGARDRGALLGRGARGAEARLLPLALRRVHARGGAGADRAGQARDATGGDDQRPPLGRVGDAATLTALLVFARLAFGCASPNGPTWRR